ncbi:MAG: hypothetical protein V4669_06890 [Pseudomonadota bacterium]
MTQTLNTFAAQAHDVLARQNNPQGREIVAGLLRNALNDRAFVESLFDDASPERKVVYEDKELGFCILAHRYTDAKDSGPHDHGPSWAIYGQADGETVMTDWAVKQAPSGDAPGKVSPLKSYSLTPGVAHVYNEGEVHSPSRAGPTRLVRIEGVNLAKVARGKYEVV